MNYISYYRKYRPQTFEEIVGQKHITHTLQNALRLNRFVHAYLFSGPRGTGKTTTARILAKALNCIQGPTPHPCNKCEICQRISSGYSLDVIEIDAASNRGIDDIRDLREKIKFTPTQGKFKIYIVDEVHMLTLDAFNALLKTLEEPPSHAIFILATTEPHRLPLTILSRCQRFDFKRISIPDIVGYLKEVAKKENLEVSLESLNLIAKTSEGALRDALSILDQVVSYSGEKIKPVDIVSILGMVNQDALFNLGEEIQKKNLTRCLEIIDQWMQEGKDVLQIIKNLIEYFRNLLLIKICEDSSNLVLYYEGYKEQLKNLSLKFSQEELLQIIKTLTEYEELVRRETHSRLLLEVAIIKIIGKSANNLEGSQKVKTDKPDKDVETDLQVGYKKEEKLDIHQIQLKWQDILRAVKKRSNSLLALVVNAEPYKIKDGNLILIYPAEDAFNKEYLLRKPNKMQIEEVLEEVLGKRLKISVVIRDRNECASQDAKKKPEYIEQTLDIFKK